MLTQLSNHEKDVNKVIKPLKVVTQLSDNKNVVQEAVELISSDQQI